MQQAILWCSEVPFMSRIQVEAGCSSQRHWRRHFLPSTGNFLPARKFSNVFVNHHWQMGWRIVVSWDELYLEPNVIQETIKGAWKPTVFLEPRNKENFMALSSAINAQSCNIHVCRGCGFELWALNWSPLETQETMVLRGMTTGQQQSPIIDLVLEGRWLPFALGAFSSRPGRQLQPGQ